MNGRIMTFLALGIALLLIGLALSRPYWRLLRKRVLNQSSEVAIHQGNCTYSSPGVALPNYFQLVGIDVSHHQGLIDWKKVKSAYVKSKPLSFVFVRATYGRWKNDKYFTYNWKATAQVGLLRGAYHYYLPTQSAVAQAEKFLSRVCGPDGKYQGDLPPVLDVEDPPKGISRDEFHREIQQWLELVEHRTGHRPILYSGATFYRVNLYPAFKSYPLWVAHYQNNQPSIPHTQSWDVWQFTDKARINGICVPVDLNVCPHIPSFFPQHALRTLHGS
ncbi:MAG: glycoside hydrolase family 25 protein [Flavobacteriales bacterium]|jgi:lysozyme